MAISTRMTKRASSSCAWNGGWTGAARSKLIDATRHYVTAAIDDGPIIEQNALRVSHRYHVEALIEKGRDIKRTVLSRAVKLHLDHRILAYGNNTVVSD